MQMQFSKVITFKMYIVFNLVLPLNNDEIID